MWSDRLPAPPRVPAKEQELTPWQRGELELEAKRCVAWMKELRRLDNGEAILAAKAPYNLDYVAAAIALLGGWFAKGNGAPNLTVAAAKLHSLGAAAPSTKATASIKAWMERLQQVDAAWKAQENEHYRIRKAQEQAEALEVLRRGVGPRTVVQGKTGVVVGAGLFRMLLRDAVESGKLDTLSREPCSLPVCSGSCENARKRPTNLALCYRCTCGSDAQETGNVVRAEPHTDAAYIARMFAAVSVK